MIGESRLINGGDAAASLQLLPCANSNGNENTIPKAETAIRTYKRQRNSRSNSAEDNNALEDARGQAGAQVLEKESAKERRNINSDGSCTNYDQANDLIISEPCQGIPSNVIVLEKYDMLSKLLSDNLQGIKVESFSDFNIINSRMKDGAYNHSIQLFSDDVQQIGLKFQKIGAEVVSLAKDLSDMSRTLHSEQDGSFANGNGVERQCKDINPVHPENMDCLGFETTKEYLFSEPELRCKPYQEDSSRSCICSSCGGKTNNRICIVCDSCEEMYHVFCVGVSVDESSPRSWYCTNCVGVGSESQHENCVVCERIYNPSTETHANDDKIGTYTNGIFSNVGEKSNCCREAVEESCQSTKRQSCKLCRCEFKSNEYRECEHYLCDNKFHLRCLSNLELQRSGPHWYCPSCLCRVCLVDQDDEEIVLCDGCDSAYHIYCMEPPRDSIPKGKWFCKVCDTRLQIIHRAKMAYEKHQREGETNSAGLDTDMVGSGTGILSTAKRLHKSCSEDEKGLLGEVHIGVGSVDMLLNAAAKLQNEENLR